MDTLAAKRLETARYHLLLKEPFYGTMMSMINYRETRSIPTIGVAAKKTGFVCVYNPDFINAIYDIHGYEARAFLRIIMKHEVEHIVRLHMSRKSSRDPNIWNIAADGLIHGHKQDKGNPFIKLLEMGDIKPIFLDDFNISYTNQSTTEEVYKTLMNKAEKTQVGVMQAGEEAKGSGNQNGDGDGESKPKVGTLDDHSTWNNSTMSESEMREATKSLINQGLQAGKAPGHLTKAIEDLMKPIINWKHELRSFVGRHCGSRRTTFARANRRFRQFGIKGISRHASIPLTICVDTSGSISDKDLKHFFSEVESASHKFKITLVQFDHNIQEIRNYRKGDWRKIEAKGRGGTCFINLMEGLKNNKAVGKANIVLTDGYASNPGPLKFPTKWFITQGGQEVEGHDCTFLPDFT